MDLSFSGAGFMGCYYFGVVNCWNKYVPKGRINRVAGASAGSLIAAYYLMDLPLSTCLREIIEMTEDIRSRPLGVFDRSNQMVDNLPRVLEKLFPEDAHKRVSGKLHVVMTRLKDMKKVVVNEFESKKDLIDALNCSCFIPVWSGSRVSTYKGVKHIDGGFSDNLPVFDEHTIRICCFSGDTDISPYDRSRKELLSGTVLNTPLYFTFANFRRGKRALFPPPASYICSLLQSGYQDTKTFILNNDLIQCDSCWNKTDRSQQTIFNQISPAISPAPSRRNSQSDLTKLAPTTETRSNKFGEESGLKNFLTVNNNRPAHELKKVNRDSFNKLLDKKLKAVEEKSCLADDNNNKPQIVIQVTNCEQQSTSSSSESSSGMSSGESSPKMEQKKPPRITESQKAFQARRSLHHVGADLLVVEDKFTLAPEPLPSCPPTPNLSRHCTKCMRMREEARLDNLEEEIRQEAEKYRNMETERALSGGGLRSKLRSPLRWIKQMGSKSSYKFEDVGEFGEIPAL